MQGEYDFFWISWLVCDWLVCDDLQLHKKSLEWLWTVIASLSSSYVYESALYLLFLFCLFLWQQKIKKNSSFLSKKLHEW